MQLQSNISEGSQLNGKSLQVFFTFFEPDRCNCMMVNYMPACLVDREITLVESCCLRLTACWHSPGWLLATVVG